MGAPRARLSPAVAAVRSAVADALADLAPGDTVLVACSGGADSLALAAAAGHVGPRAGVRVGAVVVDHGWFEGSAQVAAEVARVVAGLGLGPVEVERVRPAGRGGPESSARDARYSALEASAARHGARAILLGHTLDDQAETVLLRLVRGSGARSLAGMPARRGLVRRPLLALPRTTTLAACAAQALPVWHDPANADPAYARVRARALLARFDAELGPGIPAALARTAEVAREDAEALEALAERLLSDALRGASPPPASCPPAPIGGTPAPVEGRDGGTPASVGGTDGPVEGGEAATRGREALALEVAALTGAPDAVRRRALLLAARRAGCPAGSLARRHVLALDALLVRWHGQGAVRLPGGVSGRRACGRLMLGRADQERE